MFRLGHKVTLTGKQNPQVWGFTQAPGKKRITQLIIPTVWQAMPMDLTQVTG